MHEAGPDPTWAEADGRDVLIRIKAVPGASRDQIAGPLGDRLKIRVAAPPEDGRANKAVCTLLARAIGVPVVAVSIEAGPTSPIKTVRVAECGLDAVRRLVEEK